MSDTNTQWLEPGPKRTATAWRYFKISSLGQNTKCMLCGKVLRHNGASTSGMNRHLEKRHRNAKGVGSISFHKQMRVEAKVVSELSEFVFRIQNFR